MIKNHLKSTFNHKKQIIFISKSSIFRSNTLKSQLTLQKNVFSVKKYYFTKTSLCPGFCIFAAITSPAYDIRCKT